MGERRLIEITSKICRIGSPVEVMAYLATLNESDIYLFLKYANSSKYKELDLSRSLLAFSYDYLKNKGIYVFAAGVNGKKEMNTSIYDTYRIVMMNS